MIATQASSAAPGRSIQLAITAFFFTLSFSPSKARCRVSFSLFFIFFTLFISFFLLIFSNSSWMRGGCRPRLEEIGRTACGNLRRKVVTGARNLPVRRQRHENHVRNKNFKLKKKIK
jgi:hypothetical protein